MSGQLESQAVSSNHVTDDDLVDKKRGSRLAPSLLVMAALSPLFYVLSIGPAVWLTNNVDSEFVVSTVELVYVPLQFVFDSYLEDTWFGEKLVWYSRLWKT